MATEITLPELGENITQGDVVKVLVAVGDHVEVEQPLLELETDKASFDVPSPVAGKITELKIRQGGIAKVGEVIALVEESNGKRSVKEKEEPKQEPVIEKEEASPSDIARKEETPVSATPAPSDESVPPKLPHDAPPSMVVDSEGKLVHAAPSVRRIAREIGVNINEVVGSGPRGRITMDDVKRHAKSIITGKASVGIEIARPALPDFSKWGPVERQPMRNVRRKTAENMETAWRIPSVTQNDKADITAIEEFRKRYGRDVEAAGGKLTVTAILLKIASAALKKFPQFNASIDMARQEIIFKQYCHVGVAVDTNRGLLVPVIRDVDKKTLTQLAVDLTVMSGKAREKKITPDEMMGGTFTITNLGGIGGTSFSPIINAPEVAILGVSRGVIEPVFLNGQFQPRMMMPLSLTYDHRIIDGADAARFLRFVCETLEQPLVMMMDEA